MGLFRKIMGIPEPKQIYTKESIIVAIRGVMPKNKLDYYERLIMSEFRKVAEPLCNFIIQGLHEHAKLSKSEIDYIGNHQIIEHFIVSYATNAFLAGWGVQYGKLIKGTDQVIDQVEPTLYELEQRLNVEVTRNFNNPKVSDVFIEVYRLSFSAGIENATTHLR